jgi:hypothetical protein
VKLDTHIKVQRRVLTASGHRFLLLLLCTSVSLEVCEDMHYAGDCHLRPDWTLSSCNVLSVRLKGSPGTLVHFHTYIRPCSNSTLGKAAQHGLHVHACALGDPNPATGVTSGNINFVRVES